MNKVDCLTCSHNKVCKYRERVEKMVIPELKDDNNIIQYSVKCKEYSTGYLPRTDWTFELNPTVTNVPNWSDRSISVTCNADINKEAFETLTGTTVKTNNDLTTALNSALSKE